LRCWLGCTPTTGAGRRPSSARCVLERTSVCSSYQRLTMTLQLMRPTTGGASASQSWTPLRAPCLSGIARSALTRLAGKLFTVPTVAGIFETAVPPRVKIYTRRTHTDYHQSKMQGLLPHVCHRCLSWSRENHSGHSRVIYGKHEQ
jgi:hypothetical protein